jgi:hypothetical protein
MSLRLLQAATEDHSCDPPDPAGVSLLDDLLSHPPANLRMNPRPMHAFTRAALSLCSVSLVAFGQDARTVPVLAQGDAVVLVNPPHWS